MGYKTANIIALVITAIVTLWYYIKNGIKWERKYKKNKPDPTKIQENIENNRRYDWGVSQEKNWKNKWNSNNPKERKWFEYIALFIKAVILMFVTYYGLIVILALIDGWFFN